MVELLAEHQSYEVLHLLNVIVRVDSLLLAIRRNQTLVIKYMMQHRDRVRTLPPVREAPMQDSRHATKWGYLLHLPQVILLVNDDENEERNQLLVQVCHASER